MKKPPTIGCRRPVAICFRLGAFQWVFSPSGAGKQLLLLASYVVHSFAVNFLAQLSRSTACPGVEHTAYKCADERIVLKTPVTQGGTTGLMFIALDLAGEHSVNTDYEKIIVSDMPTPRLFCKVSESFLRSMRRRWGFLELNR